LLVLALQVVVENDPFDAGTTLLEPLHLAFVGPADLSVVFDLPCRSQLRIEHLTALDVRSLTAVGLEQIEPALGEDDRDLAVAMKRKGSDEALFAQVPKITLPWVGRLAVVVE